MASPPGANVTSEGRYTFTPLKPVRLTIACFSTDRVEKSAQPDRICC